MAAVLPFLETEQFHFPEELATDNAALAGLGAARKGKSLKQIEADAIASSNTEMTQLLWIRASMQQALQGNSFQLVRQGDEIKIRLTTPFPRFAVPWAGLVNDAQNFSLFSSNTKMRCPTWDLPAGALSVGGACPASGPAQTTSLAGRSPEVFAQERAADGMNLLVKRSDGSLGLRVTPEIPYSLVRSVCTYCYASGSGYMKTSTQLSEIVRFSTVIAAMQNKAMRDALIEAIVWQIPRLDCKGDLEHGLNETKAETQARMARYPNTIRIHSSGDFFSQPYAAMWLEIARRVYAEHGMAYRLWAPTRTHVVPKFRAWWGEQNIPPNFTIRPSAYGIGDPAPEAPGLAGGTSVLKPEDSAESKGVKFDHQCGVYDLDKGNKTCVDAMSPDNERGCRACWVRPDLRINYVAH